MGRIITKLSFILLPITYYFYLTTLKCLCTFKLFISCPHIFTLFTLTFKWKLPAIWSTVKASKTTRPPTVCSGWWQQFPAIGAEVEVSCHCWTSRCHNELHAVVLLKVISLCDVRIYFLPVYNLINRATWKKATDPAQITSDCTLNHADTGNAWTELLIHAVVCSNANSPTRCSQGAWATRTDYIVSSFWSLENTYKPRKERLCLRRSSRVTVSFRRTKQTLRCHITLRTELEATRCNVPNRRSAWTFGRRRKYRFFSKWVILHIAV